MCGRFALSAIPRPLLEMFGLKMPTIMPRYNIAPTQTVPVVLRDPGGFTVQELVWGLIPYWVKDSRVGARSINARAETVADKPTFREPFRKRRCLVPASGFYEWRKGPGRTRTPFYFTAADDQRPLIFAGLWDEWRHDDDTVRSFTIITTGADSRMASFHDRMPLVLEPTIWRRWLEGTADEALTILHENSGIPHDYREVDIYVNKVANKGEWCIQSLA